MGIAYDKVIEALRHGGFKVKTAGRDRARAQCPAHNGEDLNLALAVGDQGVLVKCQSYDCPAGDIASALGMQVSDFFDNGRGADYDYGDGHHVLRERTRDSKKIRQQNKPTTTRLYRHPASAPIETSDVVVLVEGEKCVDAALRLGETCVTTWPGGAGAVSQVDLSPLYGKRVRIIADNDDPGLKAASTLCGRLDTLATVEGVWVVPVHKESVDDLWLRGGTLSELVSATLPPVVDDRPRTVSLRTASDMRSRKMRFIWEDVFPMSCAIVIGGTGGVGKSTFMLWLAGMITAGTLRGDAFGQPADVLYVSHEDSMEEVVLNRLDANGVDRSRFHQLSIHSKKIGGDVLPDLPEDIGLIREAVQATGARMLIIDPITSTMGGDNDKVNDVRSVIDPLNALAAELGVAVFCITHFRKGGGKGEDLISGSRAYWDASRCVALFAKDEEAGDTIMTIAKGNAHPERGSYSYHQESVEIMTDEGTTTRVGRVVWGGATERTVMSVVNTDPAEAERQGELASDIIDFMMSHGGGAVTTSQIVKEFSYVKENTVRMNLTRLGKRGKLVKISHGIWQLPSESDTYPTTVPGGSDTLPENQPSLARARARGGSVTVTNVTIPDQSQKKNQAQVSLSELPMSDSDSSDTCDTPPRARAHASGVPLCRVCGYPLPDAVIASGDDTHPSCDR